MPSSCCPLEDKPVTLSHDLPYTSDIVLHESVLQLLPSINICCDSILFNPSLSLSLKAGFFRFSRSFSWLVTQRFVVKVAAPTNTATILFLVIWSLVYGLSPLSRLTGQQTAVTLPLTPGCSVDVWTSKKRKNKKSIFTLIPEKIPKIL